MPYRRNVARRGARLEAAVVLARAAPKRPSPSTQMGRFARDSHTRRTRFHSSAVSDFGGLSPGSAAAIESASSSESYRMPPNGDELRSTKTRTAAMPTAASES